MPIESFISLQSKMTDIEKVPTLRVIFADQSETEVSQLWLKTHSKMVQTMLSSSIGPKDVESITLSKVRDSEQFEQIKSTIEGDLSWLMDSKIQNKGLGLVYLTIWRTMSYLDAGFEFNWDSLNQYTIKDFNLPRILFLLDLLLDSSDQLKEKIQSKILKLFEQADQADITLWERSFYSIVSGLTSIGLEIIDLRLILDRIFQQHNLTLDKIIPFKNKFDLNPQFVPRLKEMAGSAWPWARNLIDKNIWPNGMILAGGAVITCCTGRDTSKLEPSEDLDFWIYGPTKEERKKRFKIALEYLTKGVQQEVIFSAKYCVVSLILPGDKVRMIQLIYTDKTSPEAVINQFDFGYVKCYYDGTSLYGTDEARIVLELGIIDVDPEQIKPERLYKIFRYPFIFNHFDSTVNQLKERFLSREETKPIPNEGSSEELNDQVSETKIINSSWIEKMTDQLEMYDDVQKAQQKYIHLPKGLDSKREIHLVSTNLGGNFTTKSLDQLCQNISYQPFTIQTYSDCFQITGDSVLSSGLLIDFSQIPAVYRSQIEKILPRIKRRPVVELYVRTVDGYRTKIKLIPLFEPIVLRFRNLVIKSSFCETNDKTVLDCYTFEIRKYSCPLTNALMSLRTELFMHTMYENGFLKDHNQFDIRERMAGVDKIDAVDFRGIADPVYSRDELDIKIKSPIGWLLGFNVLDSRIIRGEISSAMIVDVDIIFKGWRHDVIGRFYSRKVVKSLTVRKNLSPLLKPGKEVIGQPWKESYETRDH